MLLILFCFVGSAQTVRTPNIIYLMDEPVSLFSFGLYRLETELMLRRSDLHIYGCFPVPSIEYDWDTNRIKIELLYFGCEKERYWPKNVTDEEIKENTKTAIKTTKGILNIADGKPILNYKNSKLCQMFSHIGYSTENVPKNICKELDAITRIVVEVRVGNKSWKGQSDLLGTEILWSINNERKP